MPAIHKIFSAIDKIFPARIAHAHCDIPCGIYDPHSAQMAAHTIIRMVNLISELPPIVPQMTPEQRMEALNKIQRYILVKEQHAEILKNEVRILWGDYFKPEHLQKFPELNDLVWKTLKLASKARQEINLSASEELLESVNKISEIFWRTKGLEIFKATAPYPTKKEMIWPSL
ncbi:MAG TPA: superoxide dismutase, Ni [archaeon]|nr:superoxide dismutase, Ni [archaeon]